MIETLDDAVRFLCTLCDTYHAKIRKMDGAYLLSFDGNVYDRCGGFLDQHGCDTKAAEKSLAATFAPFLPELEASSFAVDIYSPAEVAALGERWRGAAGRLWRVRASLSIPNDPSELVARHARGFTFHSYGVECWRD